MPKMKTHSGAKKRFRPTSGGTMLKRACKNKNHILNKKSRERKRKLRHGDYVDSTQIRAMSRLVQVRRVKRAKAVEVAEVKVEVKPTAVEAKVAPKAAPTVKPAAPAAKKTEGGK